jgi:hypothetical protein
MLHLQLDYRAVGLDWEPAFACPFGYSVVNLLQKSSHKSGLCYSHDPPMIAS